jgi:hypothetical protein
MRRSMSVATSRRRHTLRIKGKWATGAICCTARARRYLLA